MKDKKELLGNKMHLSDEQLDSIGGGLFTDAHFYYGYCLDCGYKTEKRNISAMVKSLMEKHKKETGHTNNEIRNA